MENYEVLSQIGQGSFGVVQKIRRLADGKILVWKVLNYGKMSEREKQQLVSEVNIIRELRHTNIVQYYDRIIDKKTTKIFIIMEYCEGGDLGSLLKKSKRDSDYIGEDAIWKIFSQVISALNACHIRAAGRVLHRDIKPANIFFDAANNVKLGDFGLSRILGEDSRFATTNVGTPYYMSPEQISESQYAEKSDVWSAGCLLYEMAALKPPFQAQNQLALAMKIKEGKFERLPLRYSEDLQKLVESMLQVDQHARPSLSDVILLPVIALRLQERDFQSYLTLCKEKDEEVGVKEKSCEKREVTLQARQVELLRLNSHLDNLREEVNLLEEQLKASSLKKNLPPRTVLDLQRCSEQSQSTSSSVHPSPSLKSLSLTTTNNSCSVVYKKDSTMLQNSTKSKNNGSNYFTSPRDISSTNDDYQGIATEQRRHPENRASPSNLALLKDQGIASNPRGSIADKRYSYQTTTSHEYERAIDVQQQQPPDSYRCRLQSEATSSEEVLEQQRRMKGGYSSMLIYQRLQAEEEKAAMSNQTATHLVQQNNQYMYTQQPSNVRSSREYPRMDADNYREEDSPPPPPPSSASNTTTGIQSAFERYKASMIAQKSTANYSQPMQQKQQQQPQQRVKELESEHAYSNMIRQAERKTAVGQIQQHTSDRGQVVSPAIQQQQPRYSVMTTGRTSRGDNNSFDSGRRRSSPSSLEPRGEAQRYSVMTTGQGGEGNNSFDSHGNSSYSIEKQHSSISRAVSPTQLINQAAGSSRLSTKTSFHNVQQQQQQQQRAIPVMNNYSVNKPGISKSTTTNTSLTQNSQVKPNRPKGNTSSSSSSIKGELLSYLPNKQYASTQHEKNWSSTQPTNGGHLLNAKQSTLRAKSPSTMGGKLQNSSSAMPLPLQVKQPISGGIIGSSSRIDGSEENRLSNVQGGGGGGQIRQYKSGNTATFDKQSLTQTKSTLRHSGVYMQQPHANSENYYSREPAGEQHQAPFNTNKLSQVTLNQTAAVNNSWQYPQPSHTPLVGRQPTRLIDVNDNDRKRVVSPPGKGTIFPSSAAYKSYKQH